MTREGNVLSVCSICGQDLSQANCLLEFGHLLKMGSDLVGPKSHPLVPDSRISASSYFLNDAEHGFQQMWRSRLDCQDTCWVGESHDKDEHPWIQWRFSSPCKIQAISTKGRPDSDAWVGDSARREGGFGCFLVCPGFSSG